MPVFRVRLLEPRNNFKLAGQGTKYTLKICVGSSGRRLEKNCLVSRLGCPVSAAGRGGRVRYVSESAARPVVESHFQATGPECAQVIRPSVVESLKAMRPGLSGSKKQEIKNLRRRAFGLKEGHVHPRLSGEKILFFFNVTPGIRSLNLSILRISL